jgi:hypothetical protein
MPPLERTAIAVGSSGRIGCPAELVRRRSERSSLGARSRQVCLVRHRQDIGIGAVGTRLTLNADIVAAARRGPAARRSSAAQRENWPDAATSELRNGSVPRTPLEVEGQVDDGRPGTADRPGTREWPRVGLGLVLEMMTAHRRPLVRGLDARG